MGNWNSISKTCSLVSVSRFTFIYSTSILLEISTRTHPHTSKTDGEGQAESGSQFSHETNLADFRLLIKRGTLIGVNQFPLNEFQIGILIFGLNFPLLVSIPLPFSFQNGVNVICKKEFTLTVL